MLNWRKPLILSGLAATTSIGRYLKEFESMHNTSSREKVIEVQQRRLQQLLQHAYTHVPYYKALFDKLAIVQNGIVDIEQFNRIPPLTKDIIRANGNSLHSDDRDARKTYENTSGGSTGEPVALIQDQMYKDSSWANKILYTKMLGKDIGQREIKLWGSERDIFKGSESFVKRTSQWLYNRLQLNSFRMSNDDMDTYVAKINAYKPVSIWCYVDSILALAQHIERNKLSVHAPKAIIATAGTVTPDVQAYVSDIFDSPVYNQYGSREVGDMATECPDQSGLHIFEYMYYFEILNKALQPVEAGEVGEIYVTPLFNYSMPLLRYRIGDTASWAEQHATDPCACGRFFRKITNVHGRVTNHFISTTGELVHGEYFTHLFYFQEWLTHFQIIQHTLERVECVIVPTNRSIILDQSGISADIDTAQREITKKIQLVLGDSVVVSYTYVDEIPPTSSGKHLFTLSKCHN